MDLTREAHEHPAMRGRAELWHSALVLLALGVLLYPLSRFSFLAFHVVAELASIAVAAALFMVAWHARRYHVEPHLLFLATAYVASAAIDLVHTLAYKGMDIIPGYDANLPTQLWLAARYLQAVSLVIFPLVIDRPMRLWRLAGGYGLTTLALLVLAFMGLLPDAFIEGQGLTAFKVNSEYAVSALLAR